MADPGIPLEGPADPAIPLEGPLGPGIPLEGPLGPGIPLDAGDFSSWLADMRAALRGERAAHVPCGDCAACCRSSQFVHVAPDETDTLAHIPAELLFPAPGLPPGHVVLGYDERGHCPMLVDNRCSIYDHRPRTCRTYDCRIFPAAGVDPDKPLIARQAARWRFAFPTDSDRVDHQAVQAAASSPSAARSGRPTDVAVGAVMDAADPGWPRPK